MTSAILNRFSAFSLIFRRWTIGLAVVCSSLLLQGCAAVREPFHQLHYCNVGNVTLTSVKIQYGKVVWPMTADKIYGGGDTRCMGSSSISDTMPIPAVMQVTWRTQDGQKNKAEVPIRAKLNRSYPTNTIDVRFNGDQVEVFEIVRPTKSRELEFRIYP